MRSFTVVAYMLYDVHLYIASQTTSAARMEHLMRISEPQIQSIKHVIADLLGSQVQIRLFGSRLNDEARGGDIDIYIHSDVPIDRPAFTSALIQARLIRQIGERKVDIILDAPNLKRDTIHQIAEQTGVAL